MEKSEWDCICFLGLGNMGAAMVKRMLVVKSARRIVVWNRNRDKSEALGSLGAEVAATLEEVVMIMRQEKEELRNASLHLMLTGDEASHSVLKDLVDAGLKECIVVSHSTITAEGSRLCADLCSENGVKFICAPVTGRPPAAETGQLVLWTSCDSETEETMKQVQAALYPTICRSTRLISTTDVTKAPLFKLITNFMLYASGQMFAEVAAMFEKNGIPRKAISYWIDELAETSIFQGYAHRIATENYDPLSGAGLDIAIKDIKLIRKIGGSCPLPTLDATMDSLLSAKHFSSENRDWCYLAETVKRRCKEAE